MEHYFEHLLVYHKSPYIMTDPTMVPDPYPHLDADYGLFGHMTIDMDGDGVLVLWTASELALDIQQLIDHELEPDQSVYNIRHDQSLTAFQAWYHAQDQQTRLGYWAVKRAGLAAIGVNNDGTIDYTPVHRVEQMAQPLICRKCREVARWAVDDAPLCYLHLLELSRQDADYERDLFNALISPELVSVSTNEVHIKIYTSTSLAPICALLNKFLYTLPQVDSGTEIIIELWHARPSALGGMTLTHEGTGYYTIDSTTAPGLNAPLIRLTRAPTVRMHGFMHDLNEYSKMMRKHMKKEHNIGEASND
jgi:hypothetical protein